MPWMMAPRARDAVIRGSFCRSEPAAEFRGLANAALPASSSDSFSFPNASTGMNTSPLTSSAAGCPETGEPRRDGGDGPDVRRDVLAGAPVAPGGRLDQRAVPVDEVDRQPVDLQLAQVRPGAAEPRDPVRPAAQVLIGEDVVQAEQPLQVLDRGEQRGYRPVHGLGRRVGRAQVRVLLLERAQLAHRGVVLDVGDRGRIEDVVPVIGLGDLQAEVSVPPPRVGRSLLELPARFVLAHLRTRPLSPRSAQPACSPPPGTGSTRRAPRAGDTPASPQAGVITACSRARRQRQPQPLPEPDDPLRGLPCLGAAISRTAAVPSTLATGRGRSGGSRRPGRARPGPRPPAAPCPPPRTRPPRPLPPAVAG